MFVHTSKPANITANETGIETVKYIFIIVSKN